MWSMILVYVNLHGEFMKIDTNIADSRRLPASAFVFEYHRWDNVCPKHFHLEY